MRTVKDSLNEFDQKLNNTSIYLPKSDYPRIVIIGAGFAGINLVKNLENKPVQIVLLDQNNFHQFQPLLYQVAISGLEPDSIVSPIRKIFKTCKNLVYRMTKVEMIVPEKKRIITIDGIVTYDYLVIATGSSTNFYNSNNLKKYTIGMKNIQDALNIRSWILQNFEKSISLIDTERKHTHTKFIIVGGGPAGVEMAGALAEFKKYLLKSDYPEIEFDMMKIYLIQATDRLLPAMSKRSSSHAKKVLEKLGVKILLNTFVKDYDGETLTIDNKNGIDSTKAKTVIWTAGVMGNTILGIDESGIIKGNRIKVNKYSGVENHDDIFAIGDVAAMITEENPNGHPMVAQAAIQQGKTLAENILNYVKNGKFISEFEYKDKGSMAIIGKKDAVADIKSFYLKGRFGWLLWSIIHLISINSFRNKMKIAFNWMLKYFTYDKTNQLIIRKYKP